jgi:hypothetical protein
MSLLISKILVLNILNRLLTCIISFVVPNLPLIPVINNETVEKQYFYQSRQNSVFFTRLGVSTFMRNQEEQGPDSNDCIDRGQLALFNMIRPRSHAGHNIDLTNMP